MKKISLLAIFILLAGFTQAQINFYSEAPAETSPGYSPSSYYSITWNTAFPMGDFHDWVSQPSLAGFDFGGRYIIMGGLTAGFNIGWQRVAKRYDDQTFTIPERGIAITAENYRFTWMVPFQGVIGYHFKTDKMISPFVTLGIGGDYMEHHLMIQEYDIYEDRWDFSLTPEIGTIIKFGPFSSWGAIVAANYKWTTSNIEFYQEKSNNLSMFDIKIGLVSIIR